MSDPKLEQDIRKERWKNAPNRLSPEERVEELGVVDHTGGEAGADVLIQKLLYGPVATWFTPNAKREV